MGDLATILHRHPPAEIGCVAAAYAERTEQAQKDLLLILEYLAERPSGAAASDEAIQQAARLCAMPFRSLEEAQKGELWTLLNRLSPLIAPATVEGLRATRHGYSGIAGWPTLLLGVISTFVIALLLQMYALFGSQTLDARNKLNAEAQEVYAKINALEQHKPELAAAVFGAGDPGRLEAAALEYKQLHDRLQAIDGSRRGNDDNIYQWNAIWAGPVARYLYHRHPGEYWGFDCRPGVNGVCPAWQASLRAALVAGEDTAALWKSAPFGEMQIKYGSEAFARSNLETLRGLVLPVLYGALGAWVWLLRERYRQVRSRRLRPPVWGEYLQRVLLGAVFGAALGYLNLPSFLPETLANISLIGLAFIIGYNVEMVLWMFDRMFQTMREKRADEERERVEGRADVASRAAPPPPPSAAAV